MAGKKAPVGNNITSSSESEYPESQNQDQGTATDNGLDVVSGMEVRVDESDSIGAVGVNSEIRDIRNDINEVLMSLDVDILDMVELDTVFGNLIQQLRTEDHVRLVTAVEFELFSRANLNEFDTLTFVNRMRGTYGAEYSIISVWLQLRELVREVGLIGMSTQSRRVLQRNILNRYLEMEGDTSDSESESEILRDSQSAGYTSDTESEPEH